MKLIDKNAVVAKIETLQESIQKSAVDGRISEKNAGMYKTCVIVKDFLDTLDVKEVDLEKELKEDWLFADKTEVDCLECMCLTEDMFISLAKKYFELGLKTKKVSRA